VAKTCSTPKLLGPVIRSTETKAYPMVARGEFDLMVNRSDRDLSTLAFVRAQAHEAVGMIRDSDPRISIMATGASSALLQAGYMTATCSPRSLLHLLLQGGVHI